MTKGCYQFTSDIASCDMDETQKGKNLECVCCMLGQLLEEVQYFYDDYKEDKGIKQ